MNELSQFILPTLKTGDTVKLVLQSGSITGKIEEYRQDVETIDISDVYFSGVYLPFIFTISIHLIRELVKL
jgi:hypothetical protein